MMHETTPRGSEERPDRRLERQLSEFRAVPFLERPYPNLREYLQMVDADLKEEVAMVYRGEKTLSSARSFVLFFEGSPGTGKSHVAKLVKQHYDGVTKRLSERFAVPITVTKFNWDETEEDVMNLPQEELGEIRQLLFRITPVDPTHEFISDLPAFLEDRKDFEEFRERLDSLQNVALAAKRGEIPTRGVPYPDKFLQAVDTLLEIRVARFLNDQSKINVAIIDKPGATMIKTKSGDWVIRRQYGSWMLNALKKRQAPFHDILRSQVAIGGVGCVPGPYTEILIRYRDAINAAQTLEEANKIRQVFGFARFRNERQWRESQGGGTKEQVEFAREQSADLIKILTQEGKIEFPTFIDWIARRRGKIGERQTIELLRDVYAVISILHSKIDMNMVGELLSKTGTSLDEARLLENSFDLENDPPDYTTMIYINPHLRIPDRQNLQQFLRRLELNKRQRELEKSKTDRY